MRTIPFWKMSGSGNDFVVVDNRRKIIKGSYARWAKALCHRQFGVGGDGLLLLENSSEVRRPTSDVARRTAFRMVYYNADGSRADMCGNGARCMAYFAHARHAVKTVFEFQTDAYPVGAKVQGDIVKVSLADASAYSPEVKAKVGGTVYRPAFLNTGVPHAVLFVSNADKVFVSDLGRSLRFHPAFGPKGTNVNFVQKVGPRRLKIRTYERGVEGETLACGTGVTASAIAAALRGLVRAPVECVVAGGDTLLVNFDLHPESKQRPATHISLQGPVRVTFTGEFKLRGGSGV